MLKHKKGNLIDLAEAGEFAIIIHGCNCFHAMGGGIAKEIAQRYVGAAIADKEQTELGAMEKLGTWSIYNTGKFIILNCYTQHIVSRNRDVFEYTAFELILDKLVRLYPHAKIGMPYIGMGLAGGDKDRIIAMIEKAAVKQVEERAGGTMTLVEYSV